MTRRSLGLAIAGLVMSAGALRAETALVYMSPKNLKEYSFEVISRARKNKSVEFVITRDIKGNNGPGRVAFLSKPGDKNLGTPVKLREEKDTLEFRFIVAEDQIATTTFTLWGQGRGGEGITFDFKLKDFPPKRD